MNLRKHLAGLIVFSIILGSAILINHFLTIPNVRIPSATLHLAFSDTKGTSQPFNYVVRQISLDFINKKSYTELSFKRLPGQPRPEKLWVTTFFFSPEYPGEVWMRKTEVSDPFAQSDQFDFVATAWSDLALYSHTPKAGYFARVYVSTEADDYSYLMDVPFDRDIRTAVPVVVYWPNGNIPNADPAQQRYIY